MGGSRRQDHVVSRQDASFGARRTVFGMVSAWCMASGQRGSWNRITFDWIEPSAQAKAIVLQRSEPILAQKGLPDS